MAAKKVVFIESNTTGTGEIFAGLSRKMGYCPVLVTSNTERYSSYFRNEVEVVQAQTNKLDDVWAVCKRIDESSSGLTGVISSSEYYIYTASIVAKRLNLPGPDPIAVNIARNKYFQREKLQAEGIPVPAFVRAKSVTEAVSAAESIGFPVVVKPVLSSGSEGVRLCSNSVEIISHVDKLLSIKENPRGQPNPDYVLVEEFIDGPEYSVEALGDGKVKIIGITKKYLGKKPHFVEIGHDYPASLEPAESERITNLTISALKSIGLVWGPSHTEIRLAEGAPKIIEINPRLAGGMIPVLIRLVQGVDLILIILKLICGQDIQINDLVQGDCYAAIRFLIPPANGRIRKIQGLDEIRKIRRIDSVKVYERANNFKLLKGDFNDRVGHVIARDNSIAGCYYALNQALKKLNFKMVNA